MNTKKTVIVLTMAAALGACGGGGDSDSSGSSQTGSNQQTRTQMDANAAISFVKNADYQSGRIDLIDSLLVPFAPAAAAIAEGPNQKDIAFGSCALISGDPNCKGRLRVEAEFPATEPQESFRAGSALIFDWEGIEARDLTTSGSINSRWTFEFRDEISLSSRYSGQFELTENQTTPTPFRSSETYRMEQLTIKPDVGGSDSLIDGKYILNPYTGLPVDTSDEITFSNWAFVRKERKAGAQVTLYSTKYSASTPTVLTPKFRITITVISSDAGRTEYRVVAKADADDLDTTRTVIGTLDSSGQIAYSAS